MFHQPADYLDPDQGAWGEIGGPGPPSYPIINPGRGKGCMTEAEQCYYA
jgi:hypothetical protein